MGTLVDDLNLALQLADEADALTMERFGASDLRVETKPDMTPATDADLNTERLLRARLAEHR
ncbi:histidinol-phosphatase, partial [Mycobacterium sp. ITM-2017-0098]